MMASVGEIIQYHQVVALPRDLLFPAFFQGIVINHEPIWLYSFKYSCSLFGIFIPRHAEPSSMRRRKWFIYYILNNERKHMKTMASL